MWVKPLAVRTRMRRSVTTIRSDALARDAARLMRTKKIRHLPVVDRRGRLLGIVTDRDLRQVIFDASIHERLASLAETLAALTVGEIMTWGVIAVGPNTDLRAAARVMQEQKIGALPVVQRERVVGILTETDVLAAFQDVLRERVTSVRPLRARSAVAQGYDYGFLLPGWWESWPDNGSGH